MFLPKFSTSTKKKKKNNKIGKERRKDQINKPKHRKIKIKQIKLAAGKKLPLK